MILRIANAAETDAPAIARLRTAVAEQLTRQYGRGYWSSPVMEKQVLRGIRQSQVLMAQDNTGIVATARLDTRKSWAIDLSYFMSVPAAYYLHDMAVSPDRQRQGIGRQFLLGVIAIVQALPGDAIRLDAHDADAGAGPFYAKCGFREVGRVTYRKIPLIYFELIV